MMMMILTLVAWVWGVIRCRMVTMNHCWCCLHLIIVSIDAFCQIISPPLPMIRKRYAGGRILLGIMLSVKTLKTPMDSTRLLAAIKFQVMCWRIVSSILMNDDIDFGGLGVVSDMV